jgi:proteasome accessory factor A
MPATPLVPKLCGADIELGNFLLGRQASPRGSGREAAGLLLREVSRLADAPLPPAPPRASLARRRGKHPWLAPSEWGRTFLPANGGCVYIDLDHLEVCLPEVLSAYDHVAAWHALLRLVQQAQAAVNGRRRETRLQVHANTSDGLGQSYGSHLDFLMSRSAWDNLVLRKPHHLGFLAAFQASAVVFTGQGKVGSENGAEPVAYQISQRADFIETLQGLQTTFRRPLINTRDEPLAGTGLARLHVIGFDSTLCPVSCLLKAGTMQLILALLEAGWIDPTLALEDPLTALRRWSQDPLLEARAELVDGRSLTAVEVQLRFLELAGRFVETGACRGIVPHAEDLLAWWETTLIQLERRDWRGLTRSLDWVLKLSLLQRAAARRPDLTWSSPAMKHLDHLYSSLDPAEGLYWSVAAAGGVEPVVSDTAIETLEREPPPNTRAWGRAMLLRAGGPQVQHVDWDEMVFRLQGGTRSRLVRLGMPDPLGAGRDAWGPAFASGSDLETALAALARPELQAAGNGATP